MMSRWLALFLLPLFLVPMNAPVWAQQRPNIHMQGTLQIAVVYPNGTHAPAHLRVQLRQSINNIVVAVADTDTSGTAEFGGLDAGNYSVKITGNAVEPSESDVIPIEDGRGFQTVTVTVKPAEGAESGAPAAAAASASPVAAMDLNVPKKAAKEFERGGQEMADGDWDKAIESLDKATAIYPQYSSAYNDLAVCYGRLGQKEKEHEALLKAISVNDHCVPALVNLAHLEMKANHLMDAVTLLNKATAADPANVEALSLLAQVEFQQGRYEQAIADARKVHGLPHQHFAIVHYTAASALEEENRIPEAMAELQLFLQEEPQGSRADVVRKVLVTMQNQSQSQGESQTQSESLDPSR
jgi:hypothetical protein